MTKPTQPEMLQWVSRHLRNAYLRKAANPQNFERWVIVRRAIEAYDVTKETVVVNPDRPHGPLFTA